MLSGEILTVLLFVEIHNVKEELKRHIGRNYRTLYCTSVAHDIRTPVNGIMGTN
jgi:signal transduction histidine kinase